MALSQTQKAQLARAKALGNSDMSVPLDDDICSYLVNVVAYDLGLLECFPEFETPRPFFGTSPLSSLRLPGSHSWRPASD